MSSDSKIKLLVLVPTLECGGAERYVSLLCNHLDTDRFAITLAVLDHKHPFYAIDQNRVKLIDLNCGRVRNALWPIRRLINAEQPDIVYSTANHLNLLLASFRWMFLRRIIFIARESSIVSINSRRAKNPALYNRLLRAFYHRFDLFICQSDYMQQDLVAHYNIPLSKTVVINNPLAPVAENEATALWQPKAGDQAYKFITVARLSEEKGIERLIRSVALLSIPFSYHIIGEGTERKALEKLISELQLGDKVFLEGEQLHPFRHAQDADLFLSGSFYEGFPNALLEAGGYGIPVLAFDAPGGTGEIIIEGKNGHLVKGDTEKDFATGITHALQLHFDRNEIIASTKKRYSLNAIIEQTENLFKELLKAPITHSDK